MEWIRQYCKQHNLRIRHLINDDTILWDGKRKVGKILENGEYVEFNTCKVKSSDLALCIINNCKLHG